jgi:DNA-binding MarR family transcriptional regulator
MGAKSSQDSRRAELIAELGALGRDNAGLGLMVHQHIAESFGLCPTDLKALDLARHEPQLTAGRMAEITGLSTSAVTALLDRLENGGFIERRRDVQDRRKVYVVPTGRRDTEVMRVFGPLAEKMHRNLARYDEAQLAIILDYQRQMHAGMSEILRVLIEKRRADEATDEGATSGDDGPEGKPRRRAIKTAGSGR